MNKIIAAVAILLVMNIAYAGSTPTVTGHGNVPCDSWTEARKQDDMNRLSYQAWVQGFLSGVNWSGVIYTDFLKDGDYADWFVWLDNYCLRNPHSRIVDGVSTLVLELKTRNRCETC